jgi:hypothetical protein
VQIGLHYSHALSQHGKLIAWNCRSLLSLYQVVERSQVFHSRLIELVGCSVAIRPGIQLFFLRLFHSSLLLIIPAWQLIFRLEIPPIQAIFAGLVAKECELSRNSVGNFAQPFQSIGRMRCKETFFVQTFLAPQMHTNLGIFTEVVVELNENARQVLEARYLRRDQQGHVIETPAQLFERVTLANRKVGLGVMGFAELCILLGIPYSSDEAIHFADDLMGFIAREARSASRHLAEERGAFPNWERSVYRSKGLRLRNATVTSIAPTGTISIIAWTSSSIEPLFALAYRRRGMLGGQTLNEFNPIFLRQVEQRGLSTNELLDAVMQLGRLGEVLDAPKELRRLFVTALEIPADRHVQMQAAFQRHVDNAVSKTVNLPECATPLDIGDVYRLAYKLGCKGVTVFRYGSKSEQVLELGVDEASYEREHFAKCDPGAYRL